MPLPAILGGAAVASMWATVKAGLIAGLGLAVARIFVAAGVGFTTYAGLTPLVESLQADVVAEIIGAGDLVVWLGMANADKSITILFSAIVARLALGAVSLAKAR